MPQENRNNQNPSTYLVSSYITKNYIYSLYFVKDKLDSFFKLLYLCTLSNIITPKVKEKCCFAWAYS